MMVNELTRYVNIDLKKYSQSNSKNISRQNFQPKNKASGLVLNAIQTLLKCPDLALEAYAMINDLKTLDFEHVELLIDLINLLKDQQNFSVSAILEKYRNLPGCDLIAHLAVKEMLLPPNALKQEFQGSLARLIEQNRENQIEFLLKKAKEGNLSEDERVILQTLLAEAKTTS